MLARGIVLSVHSVTGGLLFKTPHGEEIGYPGEPMTVYARLDKAATEIALKALTTRGLTP